MRLVLSLVMLCLLAVPAAAGPYGRPPARHPGGAPPPVPTGPGHPGHAPPRPLGLPTSPGYPGHVPTAPQPLPSEPGDTTIPVDDGTGPGHPGHRPPPPEPRRRSLETDDAFQLIERRRDAQRRVREATARISELDPELRQWLDDWEYLERFPEARARYFAEQIDRDFPLEELDAYISERVADLEGQIEDQWDERRGAQADIERVEAEQERRRARRAGRDVIDLGTDAARSIVPAERLPVDPETGRPVINLPLGE